MDSWIGIADRQQEHEMAEHWIIWVMFFVLQSMNWLGTIITSVILGATKSLQDNVLLFEAAFNE